MSEAVFEMEDAYFRTELIRHGFSNSSVAVIICPKKYWDERQSLCGYSGDMDKSIFDPYPGVPLANGKLDDFSAYITTFSSLDECILYMTSNGFIENKELRIFPKDK